MTLTSPAVTNELAGKCCTRHWDTPRSSHYQPSLVSAAARRHRLASDVRYIDIVKHRGITPYTVKPAGSTILSSRKHGRRRGGRRACAGCRQVECKVWNPGDLKPIKSQYWRITVTNDHKVYFTWIFLYNGQLQEAELSKNCVSLRLEIENFYIYNFPNSTLQSHYWY